MDALCETQQLIHSYGLAHVIYGGDMNTDLTRSTPHAHALMNSILDFNLSVCIDAPKVEVAYTYVSPNGFISRIEHFVVTVKLGHRVLECYIIDNLVFSDHVPLKIRLDLYVDHMLERNYCHMLPWHKASTERIGQYRSDLECKLSRSLYDKGVFQCKNTICIKHVNELSKLYKNILSMCIEASECIPATCPKLN